MRTMILGLALGASALAAAASAQTTPPAPPVMPAPQMRADANGDGIVTRDEAIAQAAARFDRMDANHDGKLDQAELADRRYGRGPRDGGPPPPPPPVD